MDSRIYCRDHGSSFCVLGRPIRSCPLCISQSGSGKPGGKKEKVKVSEKEQKVKEKRYVSNTANIGEKKMY